MSVLTDLSDIYAFLIQNVISFDKLEFKIGENLYAWPEDLHWEPTLDINPEIDREVYHMTTVSASGSNTGVGGAYFYSLHNATA